MILDQMTMPQLIVQINYPTAYELWDRAGAINKKISQIWPGLDISQSEVQPNNVVLKSKSIQVSTALTQSVLIIKNQKSFDSLSADRLLDTFKVWVSELNLDVLTRLSTRVVYEKRYSTAEAANRAARELLSEQFPQRVFNQNQNSPDNSIEKSWRFLDENAFVILKINSDSLKFEFNNDSGIAEWEREPVSVNRVVVDFDRGMRSPPAAKEVRLDEWVRGTIHLLRRDFEKLIGGSHGV